MRLDRATMQTITTKLDLGHVTVKDAKRFLYCRAAWVWEDDPAPDAETVFSDPEAESTYSTQPTDLWRNHTTE